MKSITVPLDKFNNPIHRGLYILAELREIGVPVIGVLYPEGVEYGKLIVGEPDMMSGEVTWTWEVNGK